MFLQILLTFRQARDDLKTEAAPGWEGGAFPVGGRAEGGLGLHVGVLGSLRGMTGT